MGILTDAQPFTATMATGAWRAFQDISPHGKRAIQKAAGDDWLSSVANFDPASWTTLTWQAYSDGQSAWVPPSRLSCRRI